MEAGERSGEGWRNKNEQREAQRVSQRWTSEKEIDRKERRNEVDGLKGGHG